MTRFQFVELPANSRRPGHRNPLLPEFAAALRANPEQWAKYPLITGETAAKSLVYRINRQDALTPKNFLPDEDGGFEAASRGGEVYVRYTKAASAEN